MPNSAIVSQIGETRPALANPASALRTRRGRPMPPKCSLSRITVAFSWIYGHVHSKYSAFCRPAGVNRGTHRSTEGPYSRTDSRAAAVP